MEDETEVITIHLDKDVAAYIRRLAKQAGVTPDQAASVLVALSVQSYFASETKVDATPKPHGELVGGKCNRHPVVPDDQCDACNGWPGGQDPA